MNSKAEQKRSTSIKLGFLVMTLVSCWLCFKQTSSVIASLNFYGAKNYIEQWENRKEAPDAKQLSIAHEYAASAVNSHSSLALYTDTLSTVLQWQALFDNDAKKNNDLLNAAEKLNMQSVINRPAWPVTWANLAYIKWLKGEVDSTFSRYLNNASLYGPNNPDVHKAVAQFGLLMAKKDVRKFLQHKDIISKHVVQGLSNPRSQEPIIETIVNTGTLTLVCQWLSESSASVRNKVKCR